MDFQQAEEKFKQVKARFKAGTISETEFKHQLENLMVQDEHGDWWMIGYETEQWHRHDGTEWVQAEPPGRVSQLPAQKISSVSRRPYLLFSVITLLVCSTLSISGYYIFNNIKQETQRVPTTTEENILPVDIPVTGSTSTPQPTARISQTPSPTLTTQAEFQVVIAVNQAALYKGPSLQYGLAVQNPYPRGETFSVIARDPSGLWFLSSALDGSKGWLYIDWIDFDFDPLLIATAESIPPLPPTPTRKPKEKDSNPACDVIC